MPSDTQREEWLEARVNEKIERVRLQVEELKLRVLALEKSNPFPIEGEGT